MTGQFEEPWNSSWNSSYVGSSCVGSSYVGGEFLQLVVCDSWSAISRALTRGSYPKHVSLNRVEKTKAREAHRSLGIKPMSHIMRFRNNFFPFLRERMQKRRVQKDASTSPKKKRGDKKRPGVACKKRDARQKRKSTMHAKSEKARCMQKTRPKVVPRLGFCRVPRFCVHFLGRLWCAHGVLGRC